MIFRFIVCKVMFVRMSMILLSLDYTLTVPKLLTPPDA